MLAARREALSRARWRRVRERSLGLDPRQSEAPLAATLGLLEWNPLLCRRPGVSALLPARPATWDCGAAYIVG